MKKQIKRVKNFWFVHFFCYICLISLIIYISCEWINANTIIKRINEIRKTQSVIIDIQEEIIKELGTRQLKRNGFVIY